MQKVLTFETTKYPIKIDNFEGPLDLLCHLIDKNKVDVCDIKISEITDQYLDYINAMEEMNLEIASEFLVMASTLIYLKSKSLLPKEVENEEEISEEELIRRIIEYKKYKEISLKLKEMFNENSKVFFKNPDEVKLPKQKLEVEYNKEVLTEAYASIIEKSSQRLNKNAKNIEKIAIVEHYTVAEKVKDMFRELIHSKKFVFNKLFSSKKCNREEIVTAFTGLLELSRRSKVITEQNIIFGDITVQKNKKVK
mgnify:CR=1 FL=1